MFNGGGTPILTNVTFRENTGSRNGGGIYNEGGSPNLTNVVFINNITGIYDSYEGFGGGMYSDTYTAAPVLVNVIFIGNSAKAGGGMNNGGSNLTMVNVTFSGNSADYGGGIYNSDVFPYPLLTNVILWGNEATIGSQIYNEGTSSSLIISYSDIQGSGGSGAGWNTSLGIDGGGNLDIDPLFVNAAIGNLHLNPTSPVIDAGDNDAVSTATDLDGFPRFVDILTVLDTGNGTPPIIDMGAYEAFIAYQVYLPLTLRSIP